MQETSATPAAAAGSPGRATPSDLTVMIGALSVAAFASAVGMRAPDLLLPEIARDFGVTPGAASIIATMFALAYGGVQFVAGPVSDRVGKVKVIAFACGLSFLASILCAMAASLDQLTVARVVGGLATGAVIPIAMAFIGDSVPYEQRQAVLARFLSGQIFGLVFGQAVGGAVSDAFGWRAMFLLLSVLYVAAAVTVALVGRRLDRPGAPPGAARPSLRSLLSRRKVAFVLAVVAVDGLVMFGAFTFVGTDLHDRGGLSLTEAGLMVMAFGIGGALFSLTVAPMVRRLGRPRLAVFGALVVSLGYGVVWFLPSFPLAATGMLLTGYGFYAFHTTLQTEGTQMIPEARGLGMALFAALFFYGQSLGVTIGGWVYDGLGALPLYLFSAVGMPLLALVLARHLSPKG
jgi:predicted MFS family arabinose efflux permease